MRIIGGHDYYDKASAHGVDTTVIFKREPRDAIVKYEPSRMWIPEFYRHVFVIVCDKLYRGVEHDYYSLYNKRTMWTAEEWREYTKDKQVEAPRFIRRIGVDEYFTPIDVSPMVRELMLYEGFAIMKGIDDSRSIYNSSTKWIGNPTDLKNLNFFKVIDPWTMYQTLDIWVSGVMVRAGNPTVEITDNRIKLEKHGFDNRMSFRHRK